MRRPTTRRSYLFTEWVVLEERNIAIADILAARYSELMDVPLVMLMGSSHFSPALCTSLLDMVEYRLPEANVYWDEYGSDQCIDIHMKRIQTEIETLAQMSYDFKLRQRQTKRKQEPETAETEKRKKRTSWFPSHLFS